MLGRTIGGGGEDEGGLRGTNCLLADGEDVGGGGGGGRGKAGDAGPLP